MIYQRISISPLDSLGEPGPLPRAILGWTREDVADVSHLDPAYELTNTGFWPVEDEIPEYNPTTHKVTKGSLLWDTEGRRFVQQWTPEALPVVYPDLTPAQFRLGLFAAGLLDTVASAIDALEEPNKTVVKITYEYAQTIVRTDPWVDALAGALDLPSAQVDALWLWAAQN